MKAIKRMKEKANSDTTVSINEIYEQEFKVLTSLNFKISDSYSPLNGGLLPFSRLRGTLIKIRQSIVPKLRLIFFPILCIFWTKEYHDQIFHVLMLPCQIKRQKHMLKSLKP